MKTILSTTLMRVLLLALSFNCAVSINAQTRLWSAQPGTSDADFGTGVALDSVYAYVVGTTAGTIGRNTQGQRDAFLVQYDRSSGIRLWVEQIGTAGDDSAVGVTVDPFGNVYLAGTTSSTMPGGRSSGATDVWIAKYNSTGTQLWLNQIGTVGDDFACGIKADHAGHVVVAGTTNGDLGGSNQGAEDAWMASFDTASGKQLWVQQLGSSAQDTAFCVTTDLSGDVYVAGMTKGALSGTNLGSADVFLARYDSAGNRRWVKQFGTAAADVAKGVAVDSTGQIVVAGYTQGAMSGGANLGGADAFIGRYDTSGTQRWLRQFGTSGDDFANGVVVDALDQIYLAGETTGSLGDVNQGLTDAWAARYDPQGTRVWIHQTGTAPQDLVSSIAISSAYDFSLVGTTAGALGDTSSGGDDAYILQYSQNPTVDSFIPNTGATGTAVIIRGSNYYGVTSVSFNNAPATFTVNSASQLTATLPAPASTGRIRVTTAVGTATSNTNFTVTTPPAVTLTATPATRTINAGQTTTYDVNMSRANYPGAVSLSVSGQPAGTTVSFSSNNTTGSFSRLSVTPPLNTTGATYNLTIRGSATGISIPPVVMTLTVNAVRVTLTALVTARSVYAGNAATYSIIVNRTNYTGAVDLSGFFTWPTGLQVSFNPSRVTGNVSTLTLQTNPATPVGSLTFTIFGTVPGLIIAPINVTLTIIPPPVTLVAGNSANTITACESAFYDILINRTNYPGAVDLAVSGLPTDATGVFSSDPTTANRSTLTITTKCSTPAGASTFVVGATAPGFNILPISVTLNVIANPTYSQLGTEPIDGMTVDANGNVYIAGSTLTDIDGSGPEILAGESDAWVAKYTSAGVLRWVRQLGSPDRDTATAVTVDPSGNVYVTGNTEGDIDGAGPATSLGSDVWVAKFNSSGTRQWITQHGIQDSCEYPEEISVDGGGNVFVVGRLANNFNWGNGSILVRFTSTGVFTWSRPYNDQGLGDLHTYLFISSLTSDAGGNAYVVTRGAFSSSTIHVDPFTQIEKYNSNGQVVLEDTITNGDTDYAAVAVDSAGNIYLTGNTSIDFDGNGPGTHAGNGDAWLAKYDNTFNLIWSTQFGSPSWDASYDLRVDGTGVYLFGTTLGDLDGAGPGTATNSSSGSEWVARLNSSGQMLWLRQGGLPSTQIHAVDSLGTIYFADQAQVAKFSDSVLPHITGFTPNAVPAGSIVTISGNHFTGATGVTFNGVSATFTVNSSTQITATLPNGTTIGKIMVATQCGVAFSTVDFVPYGF